jgi:hypothetical protein
MEIRVLDLYEMKPEFLPAHLASQSFAAKVNLQAGDFVYDALPDKPPLPTPLQYSPIGF